MGINKTHSLKSMKNRQIANALLYLPELKRYSFVKVHAIKKTPLKGVFFDRAEGTECTAWTEDTLVVLWYFFLLK
jgi:hypothetical protein